MGVKIPFLIDTDTVRSEASEQYGGLSDAAAFHQAWRAQIDPNLEAAALKKVNEVETEKVRSDIESEGGLVSGKIEDYLGESVDDLGLTVLDAAVRAHALSVVAETEDGRYVKFVVPYNADKWVSVGISQAEAAARRNALETVDVVRLQKEMQAELERRLAEQREEIFSMLREQKAEASAESKLAERSEEEASAQADAASSDAKPEDDDDETETEVKYPRTHDELDALAKANGVTFESDAKVDAKIEALERAGVKPS